PLDQLTRPKRKNRLPVVPRWDAVEALLGRCSHLRNRAILSLLAYGGLRRSEVVSLNVGDFVPDFRLRRVQGKGGHEAALPLGGTHRPLRVSADGTARSEAERPAVCGAIQDEGRRVARGAHARPPCVQGRQGAGSGLGTS